MPSIAVRAARPADLADVQVVAEATWRATYTGHIPEDDINEFLSRNYGLDALAIALERLGPGLLIAELDGYVCGYAMLGRIGSGACELFFIYVLPSMQGRGAGFALWNAAVAHGRALGCTEVELWVLAGNYVARRFYERQGARAEAERQFPVGQASITEVRYVLTL
jgi:ribosomal protein S18 acetylase RimI-like enzyme